MLGPQAGQLSCPPAAQPPLHPAAPPLSAVAGMPPVQHPALPGRTPPQPAVSAQPPTPASASGQAPTPGPSTAQKQGTPPAQPHAAPQPLTPAQPPSVPTPQPSQQQAASALAPGTPVSMQGSRSTCPPAGHMLANGRPEDSPPCSAWMLSCALGPTPRPGWNRLRKGSSRLEALGHLLLGAAVGWPAWTLSRCCSRLDLRSPRPWWLRAQWPSAVLPRSQGLCSPRVASQERSWSGEGEGAWQAFGPPLCCHVRVCQQGRHLEHVSPAVAAAKRATLSGPQDHIAAAAAA